MQPSNTAKNLGILAGLLIAVFCGTYSAGNFISRSAANTTPAVTSAPVMLLADGVAPAPTPPPTPIVRKAKIS
ncbi:MAG TPA: hypothetical protein VMH89_14305 [Candidatus Acidoferrum sp.]|nr:hypothetical protein [Candidatus Acidoferrum sp.]